MNRLERISCHFAKGDNFSRQYFTSLILVAFQNLDSQKEIICSQREQILSYKSRPQNLHVSLSTLGKFSAKDNLKYFQLTSGFRLFGKLIE